MTKQNKILFLFLCVGVVLAFSITWYIGNQYRHAYFQVDIQAFVNTKAQLYYDIGRALNEYDSHKISVLKGKQFSTCRFPLPSQKIYTLRLDPVSTGTTFKLSHPAFVDGYGITIKPLSLQIFLPIQYTSHLDKSDKILTVFAEKVTDPQLLLSLPHPLDLKYGFHWPFFLTLCCLFTLLFYAAHKTLSSNHKYPARKKYPIRLAWGILLILVIVLGSAIFDISNQAKNDSGRQHTPVNKEIFQSHAPQHDVTLTRMDHLKLAATLYGLHKDGPKKPGIILFHGNYPEGRRHPLYQVLSDRLAENGYIVLTIDCAGYGQSEDPFALKKPKAFNLVADAEVALSYMKTIEQIDRNKIFMVGHSMGAYPALKVGIRNSAIKAIAVIGPPRRVYDRLHCPQDTNDILILYTKLRISVYHKYTFASGYTKEVWLQQLLSRDIISFLPYLSRCCHKPLLMLDGEREPSADKKFLRGYYKRCLNPVRYVTLKNASHTCNITKRGEKILYDPDVMNQTVNEITEWFSRGTPFTCNLISLGEKYLRRLIPEFLFLNRDR